MEIEEFFLRRCFQLAKAGLGRVSPNPLVGCVIEKEGRIVGEGFHPFYGAPHAEVKALVSIKDKSLIEGATLYVNLEPCVHYGKTPPCTQAIIRAGIKKVVISNVDPNPKVSGMGITELRRGGLEVVSSVLEKEGSLLNRRFFTAMRFNRPYVILKWAQSLDGFMDGDRVEEPNKPCWITNPQLKRIVHKWRAEEDAILVGKGTVQNDNPYLTVREWKGRNPVRVVLDRQLSLDPASHVFNSDAPSIVYTQLPENEIKRSRYSSDLEKQGIQDLKFVQIDWQQPIPRLLSDLYEKGIHSLIVEGGGEVLQSFLKENRWDEARVLVGNRVLMKGMRAPVIQKNLSESLRVEEDRILYYRNEKGM